MQYALATVVVWWQQNHDALAGIFLSRKTRARLRAENGR